jgi:hypothetical protein
MSFSFASTHTLPPPSPPPPPPPTPSTPPPPPHTHTPPPQDLSEGEVWRQHHSQVAHFQEEYERREQLTKAVHAAIATGRRLGYSGPFKPPPQQHGSSSSPGNTAQDGDMQQQQQQEAMLLDVEPGAPQAEQSSHAGAPSGCASEDDDESSETTHSNAGTRGSSLSGSAAGSYTELPGPAQWGHSAALGHSAGAVAQSIGGAVGGGHRAAAAAVDGDAGPVGTNDGPAGLATQGAVPAEATEQGAAAADAANDSTTSQPQQQQVDVSGSWRCGPVWGVPDYEEELRQLSEQLQVCAVCVLGGGVIECLTRLRPLTEPCFQAQGHEGWLNE